MVWPRMLDGRSEITAHFTSAPFMYQELEDNRVTKVLSSYDVVGGPHTFTVVWATHEVRQHSIARCSKPSLPRSTT